MIDPDDGEITLPGCLLLRFAPDGRCRTCGSTGRPARQAGPALWLERLTPATASVRAVAMTKRSRDGAHMVTYTLVYRRGTVRW